MAINWHITTKQSLTSLANQAVGERKYVEMTISNHPGNALLLEANKFQVGNATLDTGLDIKDITDIVDDSNRNVTTFYTWTGGNVDLGVDYVLFYDKGNPGDPGNKVGVRVYLESTFTPKADSTIYVDVDIKDGGVISEDETRKVYFKTQHTYDVRQSVTVNDITRPNVIETVVDNGTVSGTTTIRHEATDVLSSQLANNAVAHFHFKRAAEEVFETATLYQYDDKVAPPTVKFKNLGAYRKCYSFKIVPLYTGVDVTKWMVGTTSRTASILWGFDVFIYYNPSLSSATVANDDNIPHLDHTATISYNIFNPTVKPTNQIDAIKHRKTIGDKGGTIDVTVFGAPGSRYKIGVERKESETSSITAATNSYYNFVSSAFQTGAAQGIQNDKGPIGTVVNEYQGIIGSDGQTNHEVVIPKITATENSRYDIVLLPDSVEDVFSTFSSSIPIKAGDATIIQYGYKTLTLSPVVIGTESDYGSMPSGLDIKRPASIDGSYRAAYPNKAVCLVGSAVSNSKRIVLDKENKYVRSGMFAFLQNNGGGIPHLTTVKNVRGKIITLSANSTIAADSSITFASNASSVIPFEFIIPPNVKSLSPNNSDPTNAVAGFSDTVTVKTNAVLTESKTLSVASGAAKLLKAGMKLSSKNKGIVGTPKVASTTDTTIVLEDGGEQTFSKTKRLIFDAGDTNNPSSSVLHIQSIQSSTSVKIQGYLDVLTLERTTTANILVDTMVTST